MSCEKCESCEELNTNKSLEEQFDVQHKRVRNSLKYFKMSTCDPLLYKVLYNLMCADSQFADAIDYLNQKIGDNKLKKRVAALEIAVASLKTALNKTNQNVADANILIAKMQNQLEEYKIQLYELMGRVYTLEHKKICIPNKSNLLPNSTWNLGQGSWHWSTTASYEVLDPEQDKPNSHILHATGSAVTTQQAWQAPNPIYVTAGQTITIAFDFKDLHWTKSSNLIVMRVIADKDTIPTQANSLQNVLWNSNTFDISEQTSDFRRLVKSFTVKATGYLNVIPYNSDDTGNYEQWYREIMVIDGAVCAMPNKWYPLTLDEDHTGKPDWKVEGSILNQPFKTIGANLSVDENGVLSSTGGSGGDAILYPSTGQNVDGAMTQKATTDALAKKANTTELSKYVTLATNQTIKSVKKWGEIVKTSRGEKGQVTTLNPNGTLTQIQKIEGSNQYTEVEVAHGHVRVSSIKSDGTPLRNAVLTSTGVSREIDRGKTSMIVTKGWRTDAQFCYITNSTMVVHIEGARPTSPISGASGGVFKVVATLPTFFKNRLDHNWDFQWSSYGGGGSTFSGRLDAATGAMNLYAVPTNLIIKNTHRFNITLTIPLIK